MRLVLVLKVVDLMVMVKQVRLVEVLEEVWLGITSLMMTGNPNGKPPP